MEKVLLEIHQDPLFIRSQFCKDTERTKENMYMLYYKSLEERHQMVIGFWLFLFFFPNSKRMTNFCFYTFLEAFIFYSQLL